MENERRQKNASGHVTYKSPRHSKLSKKKILESNGSNGRESRPQSQSSIQQQDAVPEIKDFDPQAQAGTFTIQNTVSSKHSQNHSNHQLSKTLSPMNLNQTSNRTIDLESSRQSSNENIMHRTFQSSKRTLESGAERNDIVDIKIDTG